MLLFLKCVVAFCYAFIVLGCFFRLKCAQQSTKNTIQTNLPFLEWDLIDKVFYFPITFPDSLFSEEQCIFKIGPI